MSTKEVEIPLYLGRLTELEPVGLRSFTVCIAIIALGRGEFVVAQESPAERKNLHTNEEGSGAAGAAKPEPEDTEKEADVGPNRWSLFDSIAPGLKERGITAGGWLAQSYTANALNPNDRSNGALGVNDRSNDYELNQFALFAHQDVDKESGTMSLGWRVDAWYGSDSRWVQSQGWDDKWGSDVYTAFAMPQAYVELFLPGGHGATITAGRVWSPIGFEGVPAPDRFFLSATNLFMFAEPSTHTGVTLKYPVNEKWTVQAGVVQGWDVSDFGGGCAFLGTASWKGNDDKTTLTFVGYYGSETGDPNDRLFSTSTMLTHQLSTKWTCIMWSDFGNSQGAAVDALGNPKNGQWLGVVSCMLFAIDEKWSWGTRFEWFYDDDGTRIMEWRDETLLGEGDVYTVTTGLNYTPSPNWIIRPEVRYDWSSGVTPYDGMTRGDQFTAGVDCILRF